MGVSSHHEESEYQYGSDSVTDSGNWLGKHPLGSWVMRRSSIRNIVGKGPVTLLVPCYLLLLIIFTDRLFTSLL